MKHEAKALLRGFLIGGTMSVPGVSGGTVAIALGCYERILQAAAGLKQKENRKELFFLLLGGIPGFLGMAGLLSKAFRILPLTMTMLFLAAAGTGLLLLGREAWKEGVSLNGGLFFLLGFGIVLGIERIPEGVITASPLLGIPLGILLAAGIILPGISTSHLLLVFGLYGKITEISSATDLFALLPLAGGTALGMLILTKPLAKALERYPSYCRFALLGFAAGSMKPLIGPCIGNPQIRYLFWFQILNGLILAGGAVWGILKLNRKEKKKISGFPRS